MKILRAILVDDEPLCRQDFRDALLAFPEIKLLGEAANLTQAKSLLDKSQPDLVFLDLSLGKETGFDLLRTTGFTGAVIATTAHSQHASTGFDLDFADYLLKPVEEGRLRQALLRARRKLTNPTTLKASSNFVVDIAGAKKILSSHEIHQIESMGNYVILHSAHGKGILRSTLQAVLRRIPKQLFIQSSRGHWISRNHIGGWSRKSDGRISLILNNKSTISVSRRHAKSTVKQLTPPPIKIA